LKYVDFHVPCPCGKSSDGYVTYTDGDGKCFACDKYFKGAIAIDNESCTFQFVDSRGVSKETMQFYGVSTKVGPNGQPLELAYPYPNGLKIRNLVKKGFHATGDLSTPGLFGKDKFNAGSARAITIFEGEHDALSGYQILRYPCTSVRSSATAVADLTADYDYVNSFEKIYLCFDNDTAGKKALEAVLKQGLFEPSKVYIVKITKNGYKDCNDFLQRGEADEFKKIWWNSRRASAAEGILSSFEEFESLLDDEVKKPSIPFPFKTLNDMSYGIRTGECILFTALEGVGKTEVLRAIEYSILKNTNEKIAIIHLEESKPRLLKGLASYELHKPAHLDSSGVSEEQIKSTLRELIKEDGRLFIYDYFGSNDPDEMLRTIRYIVSQGVKYVFLDHISIVVSGNSEEDERKTLDYLSTQLAMLAESLDFALIFVSHVNDDGKTRGSRNISKVAHLRIDLHRDLEAESEDERNKTKLVVTKNRFGSTTGPAGVLVFDPKTFEIKEHKVSNIPKLPT